MDNVCASGDEAARRTGVDQFTTGGGLPTESYLYEPDGVRIRKTSNGVNTWYVNGFYEVAGSTVTKYYYYSRRRVEMKVGGIPTYLHADDIDSTVLESYLYDPDGQHRDFLSLLYYAPSGFPTGPTVTKYHFPHRRRSKFTVQL